MAIKIDISKAFDRVDWGYLKEMLLKLGFAHKFVDWIIMCVTTVNYSVLMNDELSGPIFPMRGLK